MKFKDFKTVEEAEAYEQGLLDMGASRVELRKLEIYPVVYRVEWFK